MAADRSGLCRSGSAHAPMGSPPPGVVAGSSCMDPDRRCRWWRWLLDWLTEAMGKRRPPPNMRMHLTKPRERLSSVARSPHAALQVMRGR